MINRINLYYFLNLFVRLDDLRTPKRIRMSWAVLPPEIHQAPRRPAGGVIVVSRNSYLPPLRRQHGEQLIMRIDVRSCRVADRFVLTLHDR